MARTSSDTEAHDRALRAAVACARRRSRLGAAHAGEPVGLPAIGARRVEPEAGEVVEARRVGVDAAAMARRAANRQAIADHAVAVPACRLADAHPDLATGARAELERHL